VTKRHPKDLAASVHQRLLNQAHTTRRPFGELLQYYAMERFLYRLSRSPHADEFVLKGALMLTAWQAPVSRPTRDIDLLGRMDNAVDTVVQVLREVCVQDVQPDGLSFDSSSIGGEQIAEEAEYEGVRVRFMGRLGKARIHMQVDVGFGDVVVPKPRKTTYPTILDFPAPVLAGYSRESAVAEKLQVMVRLGELNSRMRDFYDIWLLSRVFDFDGGTLAEAVRQTFARRRTVIPAHPTAFTREFGASAEKQAQWPAFLRRSALTNAPEDFAQAVGESRSFSSRSCSLCQ